MAHPDLDNVLNLIIPFAQKLIAKYGEFHPFGAQMDSDGKVACVAGYTGDECTCSEDINKLLIDGFRQQAKQGKIRAFGICYDVRTIPPGEDKKLDAICVCLEHSCGEAIDVFLPYWKGWLRRVKYGKLFAARGQVKVFE